MKVIATVVLFMALVGCRVDEMAINVIVDSQGVRFQFGYLVQPYQAVKASRLIVQDSKSRATVWELVASSRDMTNDGDDKKDYEKETFTSLLPSISFGTVPTGFEQVTPTGQREGYLQPDIKYRVIAIGERGSGMTEFTLKGECQKIPFTTFSKDLPEFNQLKDC